jgi:Glycosyl hydrolase family 26
MKKRPALPLLACLCTLIISSPSPAQNDLPSDKNATKETVNLYHNLKSLFEKGILFGHQDDLAYGVNWKYQAGRSDIKDVAGDYPAVYGWELGRIEIDNPVNLDSVPFDRMHDFIKEGYERGGVITISWHLNNPLTGKSAWEPQPGTVASILPGGAKHELYKSWLDKVANFLNQLKGNNGEFIPVIFRPFHELNGNWFWWGKKHCSPAEFIDLWKFTVDYLRKEKKLHHLLIAYNTDRFENAAEYLERYPGNEWTDIVGFDIYQRDPVNENFIKEFEKNLSTLEIIAKEKNKIPALTEFGYGGLPDSTWWTSTFWPSIRNHRIAYVLAWRNAGLHGGAMEYYVPFEGERSAGDFVKFYKEGRSLFQKEATAENLYR